MKSTAARTTRPSCLALAVFLSLSLATLAHGHELRPAYLQIDETAAGRYNVLWHTPLNAGVRLPIVLKLPEGAVDVTEAAVRVLPDSVIERRFVTISDGLAGKRIDL